MLKDISLISCVEQDVSLSGVIDDASMDILFLGSRFLFTLD